jgi:eukaryotic-like serine/threonine-protein kinase
VSQDPFVGKVIDGRYEIQARIGEGGMGVVYKARQTSIDRVIAIKMLNAQMAADPTWVQRFYNEAKACSRLQHPNTIRMFDFGQSSDGRLFMTMEFLDGMSLREAVSKGPMAPQRVVKILIQCCASLAEAHSIGIIHRDIKPDNVFLLNMAGSPDFVKLLDFSVAKLLEGDRMKTQAGVVFGTPQYMSPEQGRGLPLDARSDLYALGILAFEMLTGNVPFNDENPMTVIQMHLHGAVPPLAASIPYSVQQIVRRALEKDPSRRYQSSGEMMQHCQQVFAEVSQGGMSIGAGGMPKTMIAGGPPPGMQQPNMQQSGMQPPNMQQGMPPGMSQGGLSHQQPIQSSAGAKTMIAQPSPFAQGQMPGMQPGQMQPGQMPGQMPQMSGMQPAQGGFIQASAGQKTIVAGMAPPIVNGQMMQPGQNPYGNPMMPTGYPPTPGPQGQGGPGPNKTVMLQPSEGVISVARSGHAVPIAGSGSPQQGASTLFWIVSLVIGIAVGALGYVIVLQL